MPISDNPVSTGHPASADPHLGTSGAGTSGRGRLARLGSGCARRPWLVITIWLTVLVLAVVGRQVAGGTFSDNIDLPNTQATTGAALLTAHEPGAAGASGLVVFHVATGSLSADRAPVEESVSAIHGLPHVLSASDPFTTNPPTVSADGHTAYSTVQFDARPKTLGTDYLTKLDHAVAPARAAGVQVEYGGALDELTRPAVNDRTSVRQDWCAGLSARPSVSALAISRRGRGIWNFPCRCLRRRRATPAHHQIRSSASPKRGC